MNFLDRGFNSKSKNYLTYDPSTKSVGGYFLETKALGVWKGIIKRTTGNHKGYENCSLVDSWLDYQNFAEFYYEDLYRKDGWELDKDILLKGNTIYGPDTCCFIPQEINAVLVNFKGIKNRERSDLPLGVSIHSKTGLYRARVNDSLTGKSLVKYFKTVDEAKNCYVEMKSKQIQQIAEKWKDEINPDVFNALLKREI